MLKYLCEMSSPCYILDITFLRDSEKPYLQLSCQRRAFCIPQPNDYGLIFQLTRTPMYRQNRKYVEITQSVKRVSTLKIVSYTQGLHLVFCQFDMIISYQASQNYPNSLYVCFRRTRQQLNIHSYFHAFDESTRIRHYSNMHHI